jgi:hypothetical protein
MIAAKSLINYRIKAGRQSRPAERSFVHIVFDSLDLGFGEDRKAIRDQVNRVLGVLIDLVF